MTRDPLLGAALLARARNAIATSLGVHEAPEPWHAALVDAGATFVTLHVDGALRGCIGRLVPSRALDDDVRANAMAAAFDDHRFASIAHEELPRLQIEVSVLGPATPLNATSEAEALRVLRPGVDGVILSWRGQSATFLPQVWTNLPDPAEFLRALKRKAGLPADFWADDLHLSRYQVVEYVEGDAHGASGSHD